MKYKIVDREKKIVDFGDFLIYWKNPDPKFSNGIIYPRDLRVVVCGADITSKITDVRISIGADKPLEIEVDYIPGVCVSYD